MAQENDILDGVFIAKQSPLDKKIVVTTLAELSTLGVDDVKAFTYYKAIKIIVQEDLSEWIWRPTELDEPESGLLTTDFTYPDNLIVRGIDYSNIAYNFYPAIPDDEDNIVRSLIINEIDLPEGYTKQDICTYILALDSTYRTIAKIDSKWNIVIGQQAEDVLIPKFIYEIQNIGRGIIETLVPNNLLLITDRPKGLQDILNVDSNLPFPAYVVVNQSFTLSTLNANGQNIIEIRDNDDVDDVTYPAIRIGKSINNELTIMSIDIFNTKMVITDGLNNKGIEYAGDYSANFTANSLITKVFAEGLIAEIDGSETKLVNGTNTTVVGNGTIATPYSVNVTFPLETGVQYLVKQLVGWDVDLQYSVATPELAGKTIVNVFPTLQCIVPTFNYLVGHITNPSTPKLQDSGGLDENGIGVQFINSTPTVINVNVLKEVTITRGHTSDGATIDSVNANPSDWNIRLVILYV